MSENILKINQHHLNQRVDNYLFSKFKLIPKSKMYSAIRKGEIRINSKRVKPSTKLKFEDLVRVPPNFINSDNSVNQRVLGMYVHYKGGDHVLQRGNKFLICERNFHAY